MTTTALSLVFGGCCSNALSLEGLLSRTRHHSGDVGSVLTLVQMLFIATQSLPNVVSPSGWRPRAIPLHVWAMQMIAFSASSLLNNWAFRYDVPLPVAIVFRSGGLAVSMLLGHVVLKRSYAWRQVLAVVLVSAGVVVSTLSHVDASPTETGEKIHDTSAYSTGIAMLAVSLVLTGMQGLLQEQTFAQYGPHWQEGMFYTHAMSVPLILAIAKDVRSSFGALVGDRTTVMVLAVNLVTQLACASGVNRLTAKVSSVSTSLALTARKAMSLCLNIWWFGSGWNAKLAVGATMVLAGSLLYTTSTTTRTKEKDE